MAAGRLRRQHRPVAAMISRCGTLLLQLAAVLLLLLLLLLSGEVLRVDASAAAFLGSAARNRWGGAPPPPPSSSDFPLRRRQRWTEPSSWRNTPDYHGSSSSRSSRTAQTATTSSSSPPAANVLTPSSTVTVKECIGSGSYGTVHVLEIDNSGGDGAVEYIGKRAWTLDELREMNANLTDDVLAEKARRCEAYFDVEVHCFGKLPPTNPCLPRYLGVVASGGGGNGGKATKSKSADQQYSWMVFERVAGGECLEDILKREHQHASSTAAASSASSGEKKRVVYPQLTRALGLVSANGGDADADGEAPSLTECMDAVITDVLRGLVHIHDHNIVHRDVKPGNLLVANREQQRGRAIDGGANDDEEEAPSRLVLIDFGSAADLDTAGLLKKNVGLEREFVAISPIYTAPEVFIEPSRPAEAMTFDCFSAALLFCQLLFELTDERTDAGFHQQLESADWNLDTWLNNELQGKVIPVGLDEALEVLEERPGLWRLLQDMLRTDPRDRVQSVEALERWNDIRSGVVDATVDGPFLMEVLESFETCMVPVEEKAAVAKMRPLHFVASFRRKESLGLILAEAAGIEEEDDDDDELTDSSARQRWEKATEGALPGEVFVKGVVKGGQADRLGIFMVGDRLQGVGELPLAEGGFEKAVMMLQDQPQSSTYVTLHFDRKSASVLPGDDGKLSSPILDAPIQPKDQGAWSSLGRRSAQEDAFVINEVHDTKQRSILLLGVMDGHLGKAASTFVRDNLPEVFSDDLIRSDNDPSEVLLERAWNDVCDMYRSQCNSDSCTADYDPRLGVLQAFTGSDDTVAGTTASLIALDMQTSHLAVLNCGDSRGIVLDPRGKVAFQTTDHNPGLEIERFEEGRALGLDYGQPECRFSTWRVPVGDYMYAVSRSLEGSFATSKGIVSDPDVSLVQAEHGMTALVATDGFWEVIDVEEASRILSQIRHRQSMSAGDAAKALCSLALEKGTSDNVSCVVLYL